jgi:tRNA(Ile)-lysidine synthase
MRVGVGVSGGADSLALLCLLHEASDKLGVVPSVVHFNHKLRGNASEADERFVASLAEKLGLTLHVGRGDIGAKAKREKANLEDAARQARYSFFHRVIAGGLVDCVATAHTADDQAETVLAHILRGTGLAGLAGIHPATSDGIVRPLLEVRRGELRKYLRLRKQKWREDATNKDTTRTRARMRKKLLPLLETQFNPKAVEHLGMLARLARQDEAFLAALAVERCEKLTKSAEGCLRIPAADLVRPMASLNKEYVEAISGRLVRLLAKKIKQGTNELGAVHVRAVLLLAQSGENGKALQLPGRVDVRRDDDWVVFLPRIAKTGASGAPKNFAYPVKLGHSGCSVAVAELGCIIRLKSIDWSEAQRETNKDGQFALDLEKLAAPLVLRSLRPGDWMRPAGHRAVHKLKRLLNEKRVSRWERDGWPVLESGQNIVWARGFAAAEFAATRDTRKAILITEERA